MFPRAKPTAPSLPSSSHAPIWLLTSFWICIAISVAVVLRRVVAFANPSPGGPPQVVALDNTFAAHSALTLAHILPALLFVLVAPIVVFRPSIRLTQRLFYPFGAIVGLTAYLMSAYAVGGWTERSAVLLFDTLFLFSLACAYRFHYIDAARERRWQLRAVAILLGIATTRPVMGIFFATAARTHLVPSQFFGIAFWIGFSINVLIFELWVLSAEQHRERKTQLQIPNSPMRSATWRQRLRKTSKA